MSSIPREIGSEKCPHLSQNDQKTCPINDDTGNNPNWVYPSPKMFWEAMNRKGTLPAHLKDPNSEATKEELDWIVTIHNIVNEQCWQEVCKWEKFRVEGCKGAAEEPDVKLQRFLGRPDDLSPRAWFKSTVLGYRRPFDRHDWYVKSSSNPDEPPRRYVIDFYAGKGDKNEAASFYLDFGLETPLGRSAEILQGHEETIKTFLCGKEVKENRILIYLDNEDGTIGIEDGANGKKGRVRKGKVLSEIWTLKFNPKNVFDDDVNEGEIRKLYKRTTLYIRSLFTISRLLPSYSILQQKLPLKIEIEKDGDSLSSEVLSESLIASAEGDNKTFEAVNSTSLSILQTTHGDLEIGVQFKKLTGKLYTIVRSPAIRVPQQVIKAKDIQITSSPATTTTGAGVGIGSGEWIDMTQQNMFSLKKQTSSATTGQGQIKILTTAHKPGGSSLANDTSIKETTLTDFIKILEKAQDLVSFSMSTTSIPMGMGPVQLIEKLDQGRSKKILFDRWLEELEIEHESLISEGFDLINNME